ncbi:hypothetical protein QOT17_018980 [Balamuthia mandrillaris]
MERERETKRARSSSATPLPSEVLSLVFHSLSWREYAPACLVNKEWAAALQVPSVQQAIALRAERDYLFFPEGFLQARIPADEQWAFFKEKMMPIIRDFSLLLSALRSASAADVDETVLQTQVDVVTAITTAPAGLVTGRRSHLGARPHETITDEMAKSAERHTVIACLFCEEESLQKSMGAYQVLPSKGTLLFLAKDWREPLVLFVDPDDEAKETKDERPEKKFQRLGITEGEEVQQLERFTSLQDCLWLADSARTALSLEWSAWNKALDAWKEARDSSFAFVPGFYPPPHCSRLGGRDAFDGQGNFVLEANQSIIIQTGHEMGGLWGSWGYYADKEVIRSVAASDSGSEYAKPGVVQCDLVDNC